MARWDTGDMRFPSVGQSGRTDTRPDGGRRSGGPIWDRQASQRPHWRGLRRSRVVYIIAAIMVVTFLTGMATGFDLMVRLNYVLATVLIVAYLWATAGLQRLDAAVSRPKGKLSVGDRVTEEIVVWNRGGAPKAWVEVEDVSDIPGFRVRQVTGLGVLVSFSRFTASAELPQRGEYSLGPLLVRASDPFDMFPQEAAFGEIERILVFPRIVPLPDFAGPATQIVGESTPRQRLHAISTDTSSVREYVAGDSENRIHWLTSALTGALMVKQFDRGSASHVWVAFDMHADTVAGEGAESTDEYGATLAASIVDKYLGMALPVGYAAQGGEPVTLQPERGSHQREMIMNHLASARPTGSVSLLDLLAGLERGLSQSSTLVVITAAGDGPWVEAVEGLQRRGVRVVVALVDSESFGGAGNRDAARNLLSRGVRTFGVTRDVPLFVSLSEPIGEAWRTTASRTPSEPARHREIAETGNADGTGGGVS